MNFFFSSLISLIKHKGFFSLQRNFHNGFYFLLKFCFNTIYMFYSDWRKTVSFNFMSADYKYFVKGNIFEASLL